MRILVVGGAGEMGAYAVRALAESDAVDEVIVADRDAGRAAAVAQDAGAKASARTLDVSDRDAVRNALAGVDIVLSAAGPFYLLGLPVLEAAIDAGVGYLDICDDWEPTLEMLELDARARGAGVTAVIGMGASPGISNLLAAIAMFECDRVDRVFTAWRASAPARELANPGQSTAALDHWIHNCSDPIKFWRDGQMTSGWALEETTIKYPGRAAGSVWVCGHPEPLTIPRYRPEVRESLNVMTARPGLMAAVKRVADRVRSGELDVPTAGRRLLDEPNLGGPAAGEAPDFPTLFALVEGVKDGTPVRVGARPVAAPYKNMGEATGIPLAVATLMLVRGEVSAPGVHAPEGALDAQTFFRDLVQQFPDAENRATPVEVLVEAV